MGNRFNLIYQAGSAPPQMEKSKEQSIMLARAKFYRTQEHVTFCSVFGDTGNTVETWGVLVPWWPDGEGSIG